MSPRLKLTVAYDGAAFAGWQSQAHGNTAQDQLERAVHKISGQRVRVHGAGRTDTGVHAVAQCAHVDLPNRRLSVKRLARALNAILPPSIRVLDCRSVPENFHARVSAIGKVYRYRTWTGPILPLCRTGYGTVLSKNLVLTLLFDVRLASVGIGAAAVAGELLDSNYGRSVGRRLRTK